MLLCINIVRNLCANFHLLFSRNVFACLRPSPRLSRPFMLSAIGSSGGLDNDVPQSNVSPRGLYEAFFFFFYSENRSTCLVSEGRLFCFVNPPDKTCVEMSVTQTLISFKLPHLYFMFAISSGLWALKLRSDLVCLVPLQVGVFDLNRCIKRFWKVSDKHWKLLFFLCICYTKSNKRTIQWSFF